MTLCTIMTFTMQQQQQQQQQLTSGRLQKCGFTPLHSHSSCKSGPSDVKLISPFTVIGHDITPNSSLLSAHSHSNDSSTLNETLTTTTKKRRNGRSRRRRSRKNKTSLSLSSTVTVNDPDTPTPHVHAPSAWLDFSFPDRTPSYTDYLVNYWRQSIQTEQLLSMDHFTSIMTAVHEDLRARSVVRSARLDNGTQSICVGAGVDADVDDESNYFDAQTHLDDTTGFIYPPPPLQESLDEDDEPLFHLPEFLLVECGIPSRMEVSTHDARSECTDVDMDMDIDIIKCATTFHPERCISPSCSLCLGLSGSPSDSIRNARVIYETTPIPTIRCDFVSRREKMLRFSNMSTDEKMEEIDRLILWFKTLERCR